jgi:hypothetical protein
VATVSCILCRSIYIHIYYIHTYIGLYTYIHTHSHNGGGGGGREYFSVPQKAQTGSGPRRAPSFLYTVVTLLGSGVDLLPLSSAEVKHEWSHTTAPPIRHHGADTQNYAPCRFSLLPTQQHSQTFNDTHRCSARTTDSHSLLASGGVFCSFVCCM